MRSRRAWALLPAVILLAAGVLALLSPRRLNHDCALYLQCAQLLLEGQRPYLDFVDLNPPFVFYLNVLPVLLSRWLWIPLPLVFTGGVLLLAAGSTLAIQRSLGRDARTAELALPVAALWAAITFALRMSNDFGQREHLLLLLFLPYLVARGLEAGDPGRGRARVPWRGVAAGLAICLKPQWILAAFAVELWVCASRRSLRSAVDAEARALWAAPLLYAAHFAFLPADVRAAFFGRWLPLVSARYSVYDGTPAEIFHWSVLLAGALGVVAMVLAWRRRSEAGLAGVLGAFVASGAAIVLLQHKGWPYHRMPVVAMTAVLLMVLASRRRAGAAAGARWLAVAARVAPFALGVIWVLLATPLPLPLVDPPDWEPPLTPILDDFSQRGDPVLVVASGVDPAYPMLLESDRRPGSRYLWFFPIPMLAREVREWRKPAGGSASERARLDAEEQRFLRDLAQDLDERSPPVVIVSTRSDEQGCPPGFTLAGYLERHGILARIAAGRVQLPGIPGQLVFVRPRR